MTYILLIVAFGLIVGTRSISKRVTAIEKSIPSGIERAKHEGWYDGFTYANQCHERRHPRDKEGKFTQRRT